MTIAGVNENDRHVLAGAVVAKVGVLVTNNLKHFSAEACGEFGVEVQSADEFLVHALSLEPFVVHEALSRQASIKRRPSMSVADVLDHLEKTGSHIRERSAGRVGNQIKGPIAGACPAVPRGTAGAQNRGTRRTLKDTTGDDNSGD